VQTRVEVMHALVQRLADRCARLEGRPAQPVPRLDNVLSLPDQLQVMVADLALVGASDEEIEAAIADIEATAARL
jgi:HPt (histidine-containing phosphotransfer) domain-containing protein